MILGGNVPTFSASPRVGLESKATSGTQDGGRDLLSHRGVPPGDETGSE